MGGIVADCLAGVKFQDICMNRHASLPASAPSLRLGALHFLNSGAAHPAPVPCCCHARFACLRINPAKQQCYDAFPKHLAPTGVGGSESGQPWTFYRFL